MHRLRKTRSRCLFGVHALIFSRVLSHLAYNGTKMILFGGNTDMTQSVDTLYILDVPSMTWTQAPSSLDARSDMACSVSGDNFIVWGGKRTFLSLVPLLYSLRKRIHYFFSFLDCYRTDRHVFSFLRFQLP
jgi:hypothetical protein